MQFGADHSGGRFKRNLALRSCHLAGEPGETTRTVAAHFRFASVAVVVPHSEIGPVCRVLQEQNSIRTNPAVTVAYPGDLFRAEKNIAGTIIDHNEIVPGAIHLHKAQHALL